MIRSTLLALALFAAVLAVLTFSASMEERVSKHSGTMAPRKGDDSSQNDRRAVSTAQEGEQNGLHQGDRLRLPFIGLSETGEGGGVQLSQWFDGAILSGMWQEDGKGVAGTGVSRPFLLGSRREAALRSSPALARPQTQVTPLSGRHEPFCGPLCDSGDGSTMEARWSYKPEVAGSNPARPTTSLWEDPLLTHRIFVGRDGVVLISREIAPDPDFWAGVGVAGCESAWRARIDSPTGDRGFWQLNRRWQEWRALRRDWTWEDMNDAEKNTEIAFEIWSEQSWQPWTTKSCVGRSLGTSEGGY